MIYFVFPFLESVLVALFLSVPFFRLGPPGVRRVSICLFHDGGVAVAAIWSFDAGSTHPHLCYFEIFDQTLPEDLQFWCFLVLTTAFLIQIPTPPFHGWIRTFTRKPLAGPSF